MANIQPFSYGSLEVEIAEAVQAAASRIRENYANHTRAAIAVGIELTGVKRLLGHGQFLPWLATEFRWSDRTARNYMALAEHLGDKSEIIADLELTAAYALTAPSTPADVRQAVVQQLEAKQPVTPAQIKNAVQDARAVVRKENELAKLSPSGRRAKKKRDATEAQLQAVSRKKAERRHAANERVVEILRERLGEAMHEFLAALKEADWWEIVQLLRHDDGEADRAA